MIDDFTLSRNIARFGLKYKTLMQIQKDLGFEEANFFWHTYTVATQEKIRQMKQVLYRWKLD